MAVSSRLKFVPASRTNEKARLVPGFSMGLGVKKAALSSRLDSVNGFCGQECLQVSQRPMPSTTVMIPSINQNVFRCSLIQGIKVNLARTKI